MEQVDGIRTPLLRMLTPAQELAEYERIEQVYEKVSAKDQPVLTQDIPFRHSISFGSTLADMAVTPSEPEDDLEDWLELTLFHDEAHRRHQLGMFRKTKRIKQLQMDIVNMARESPPIVFRLRSFERSGTSPAMPPLPELTDQELRGGKDSLVTHVGELGPPDRKLSEDGTSNFSSPREYRKHPRASSEPHSPPKRGKFEREHAEQLRATPSSEDHVKESSMPPPEIPRSTVPASRRQSVPNPAGTPSRHRSGTQSGRRASYNNNNYQHGRGAGAPLRIGRYQVSGHAPALHGAARRMSQPPGREVGRGWSDQYSRDAGGYNHWESGGYSYGASPRQGGGRGGSR